MIEIIWLKKVTGIRDPIALVGMPGIASVGKLAIEVLIRSLDAEPIVQVLSDDFPPHVMIDEEGMMKIPECQIYLHRNPSLKQDILLVSGDFQPSTSQGIYEFSDRIAETFKKLNVTRVAATGAYVPGEYPESPKVFVSSTSSEFQEFFTKLDYVVPMSDGVINGANGVIPAWAKLKYGIEGVCLLAETIPILATDPKASKAIVEILGKWFNIGIDMSALDKQIATMERAFEKLRGRLDKRLPEGSDRQSYIS